MLPRLIFLLCLLISASGFVSPPVALAMGLVFGLFLPHPYGKESKKSSKFLLQASVVGLGFGMNLHQVLQAGRSGFLYTMLGISFALIIGMSLGALLRTSILDFHWDRNLWRQRDCRRGTHYPGQRR
jgi:uncharacterized membrane protein YadS